MTTLFTTFPFKAAAVGEAIPTTARTLPDRLNDVVNVRDYGATGDIGDDQTVAIQNALASAWGNAASPHGINYHLNRPVFFPAGNYKVTDTLYIQGVFGGYMYGEGSSTTKLIYAGSKTNIKPLAPPPPATGTAPQDKCNLFFANACAYSRFEGLSFVQTAGNLLADKTCCFNWNWDGVNFTTTTQITFIDVGFEGGTYGCLMADPFGSGGPGDWGNQCDTGFWLNCWINNCYYGARSIGQNCMNTAWIGGSVKNCAGAGFFGNLPICVLQGINFSGNAQDISYAHPFALLVINCKSNGPIFCASAASGTTILGCEHTGGGMFSYNDVTTLGTCIDGCKTNGTINGQGLYFINNTEFTNPAWCNVGTANICELASNGPFNFSELPAAAALAKGLTVSIKDSPTNSHFASVTSGGGGNHVQLWFDGTNLKVVGA